MKGSNGQGELIQNLGVRVIHFRSLGYIWEVFDDSNGPEGPTVLWSGEHKDKNVAFRQGLVKLANYINKLM